MAAGPEPSPTRATAEWAGGALLVALAVGLRLAFVARFPTIPISDFASLVGFGRHLRDHGLAAPGWWWAQFNAGLPTALSFLDRIFPRDGVQLARTATAVWTGLLPLFPFLLWRRVLSRGWRLAAGLLFALWPGQICFSSVVAQDNWVLVPAVALGALAVRRLRRPEFGTDPVAAGLLFAAAVAIRQEMLFVLAPLLLAASLSRVDFRRSAIRLAAAAGIPLLLLASQRGLATGRFSLTTEHGGLAFLGSFVPGAAAAGWIHPGPYVASVEPEALESLDRFRSSATRLAWKEARRRPAFHALRIATAALRLARESDGENLYWSVAGADVLPAARREAGGRLVRRLRPWLFLELGVVQGLFLAALLVGVFQRDRAILALGLSVFLKIGLHALASPMSRLVVPATALAILTIPLGAAALGRSSRRVRVAAAAITVAVPLFLALLVPRLEAAVASRDRDDPRTYRFPLEIAGSAERARCEMRQGRLRDLQWDYATIETFAADPKPGERARVTCRLPPLSAGETLLLRLEDRYAAGGLPGRIVERVEAGGREVLFHDIADKPYAGWLTVPVADASDPPGRPVEIEIRAVAPDPGWAWGRVGAATFRFAIRTAPP